MMCTIKISLNLYSILAFIFSQVNNSVHQFCKKALIWLNGEKTKTKSLLVINNLQLANKSPLQQNRFVTLLILHTSVQ